MALVCGRGSLPLGVWLGHAVALAALAALAGLAAPTSPAQGWLHATGLLWLGTWLPGLSVAVRLRQVWPALGAGDPGLGWVDLRSRWLGLPRVGAVLGAVGALLVLQVAMALGFGAMATLAATPPAFATARTLARRPAAAGIDLALPARQAPCELRLRARSILGPHLGELTVEAGFVPQVPGAAATGLGRVVFDSAGTIGRLQVPAGAAGTLQLAADPESRLALLHADAWLITTPVPAALGCALLALRPLLWSVALLLCAVLLAPVLRAATSEVAVLALGLPLALVETGTSEPIEELLALGLAPDPTQALTRCLPILGAVLVAAVALVPRSRGR